MASLLLFLGCDVRKRWYLDLVSSGFCGNRVHGLEVPDLLRVFADGAIAGEDARAGRVQHGFAYPGIVVAIVAINLLLRVDVAAEIGKVEVALVVAHERIVDAAEETGLAGREDVVGERVHHAADAVVAVVELARMVRMLARLPQDFWSLESEDINIFFADVIRDLD